MKAKVAARVQRQRCVSVKAGKGLGEALLALGFFLSGPLDSLSGSPMPKCKCVLTLGCCA